MTSEKENNKQSNVLLDYTRYDPIISEELKKLIIYFSETYHSDMTSKDIHRKFNCGSHFAAKLVSHLNFDLGILEDTEDIIKGRKKYSIQKNKIPLIGDVHSKIIPQILNVENNHSFDPEVAFATILNNKAYLIKQDSEKTVSGLLNDSGIKDILVLEFNPKTYYINSVKKVNSLQTKRYENGTCANNISYDIQNALENGQSYNISFQNAYDVFRIEAFQKNQTPTNTNTNTLQTLKNQIYIIKSTIY